MFQDVLLFELFQRTLPLILFYFHLNQLSNFPTKTYRSENMLFSGHLSSQSAWAVTWKQAQLSNDLYLIITLRTLLSAFMTKFFREKYVLPK